MKVNMYILVAVILCMIIDIYSIEVNDITSKPLVNIQWTQTKGTRPQVRSGAQFTRVGNQVIMLFGYFECFFENAPFCDNFFYSQNLTSILSLNSNPFAWVTVSTTGNPPGRSFFGADSWEAQNKAIFFGGIQFNANLTSFAVFGDIWTFNVATNAYQQIIPTNIGPGPRIGIQIKVFGDAFYFFGGFDAFLNAHNDMWKFNLTTNAWTLLIPDNNSTSAPTPRYNYLAVFWPDKARYYFFSGSEVDNGVQFVTVQDTWYFDISANVFVKVLATAPGEGRIHSATTFYQSQNNKKHFWIAVQGSENIEGEGEECPDISLAGRQNATDTILFLDLDNTNLGWRYANVGINTIGMKRLVGFLIDDTFHFGEGYGFECADDIMSSPIWNPYLWNLDATKVADQ